MTPLVHASFARGFAAVAFLWTLWLGRAAVPFSLPFDASQYDGGPLEARSDDGLSGATVYWRVDADNIYLGLAANALYAAFGLNVRGPGMAGADIVVCREHEADHVSAADYHSKRYGTPELDVVQDWVTFAGGRAYPTLPTSPPGACRSGYTWSGSNCFKVSTEELSWTKAKEACETDGAQLAKISGSYENDLVRQLASTGNPKVWIGANERGRSEGSYVWVDGSALDYSNWQHGEPNNHNGLDEECVFIGFLSNADSKWYDATCGWAQLRYACSEPVADGTPVTSPTDMARVSNTKPVTWCEIARSRTNCDTSEDVQIKDLDLIMHGLLAWSPSHAASDALMYHSNSHRRTMPFSFSQPPPPSLPSDAATITLTAPDHIVPVIAGSYACSYHVLPVDANTRYHIINYKVSVGGPSVAAGVFHHVDVNSCDTAVVGMSDGQSASCEAFMGACPNTLLNGGYGPSGTNTPPDAGIPIGKGSTMYVVLSRHFYNPALKTGVLDTGTSYRLTYTASVRERDLSQITLGTTQLVVPASSFGYTVSAHCASSCSERLGRSSVTNVAFHMHGHGKRTAVRLIRDGVELEPLAALDPWDQSQANVATNREVLPGDQLILDCTYDNDLSTDLMYGDGIDQEMCFAFLNVIGQSAIKQCLDLPLGFQTTPPAACDGYSHLPQCNFTKARSYCPDKTDSSATVAFITEEERSSAFTPYIDQNLGLCADATGPGEEVPAIAGSCQNDVVTGVRDCGLGVDVDFQVSWTSNCTSQTVTFELDARLSGSSWLAVGLHDAGTATEKIPLAPTRMNGADVVQVSASAGTLRDGMTFDYTAPTTKASPVALLASAEFVAGRSRVSFVRPFVSTEGLTLAENRFVWLMCAYRRSSSDFDAKHHAANAVVASRVSLFGGVPESTRYVRGGGPTPGTAGMPSGNQAGGGLTRRTNSTGGLTSGAPHGRSYLGNCFVLLCCSMWLHGASQRRRGALGISQQPAAHQQ